MASSARRRTYDYTKPNDEGLAEWTSKIRDLQSQVDEDEAAEQRRLLDDIQQSRMERAKRRSGIPSSPMNFAKSTSAIPDDLQPIVEAQNNGSEALRKLVGGESGTPPAVEQPSSNASIPVSSSTGKPQPVSLAAFIGGRATGPRLNRPAAQSDIPETLDSRPYVHSASPLAQVASGTGGPANAKTGRGVTLPGMSNREQPSAEPTLGSSSKLDGPAPKPLKRSVSNEVAPSPKLNAPKGSLANIAQLSSDLRYMEPVQRRPSAPSQVTPAADPSLSTPPQVTIIAPPPSTPVRSRTISSPISPQSATPTSSSIGISAPGLARPIQPAPSTPPSFVPSSTVSPAFLRTQAPAKELTPSLTRLQGRGFVQKVSSAIVENATSDSRSKAEPLPPKKLSNVLSRWQTAEPSALPVSSTPPKPLRKSWTNDSLNVTSLDSPPASPISKAPPSAPPFSETFSLPPPTRPRKLSTPPLNPSLVPPASPNADKAGGSSPKMRKRKSVHFGDDVKSAETAEESKKQDVTSDVSPAPLVPLTKDRARKTRKVSSSIKTAPSASEGVSATIKPSTDIFPVAASSPPANEPKPVSNSPVVRNSTNASVEKLTSVEASVAPAWKSAPSNTKPSQPATSLPVPQNNTPYPNGSSARSEQIITPRTSPLIPPKPPLAVAAHSSSNDRPQNNVARLKEAWQSQAPIQAKYTLNPTKTPDPPLPPPKPLGINAARRRALPGLAAFSQPPANGPERAAIPEPTPEVITPTRSPSFSSRPSVIDVAKSMSEQTQVDALSPVRSLEAPVNKEAGVTSPIELEAEPAPAIDVKAAAQGWQRTAALPDDRAEAIKAERRRSNYEKYASITLPPLKEVKTPDVTPAPSLSRATAKPPDPAEIVMEEIVPPDHPVAEHRLESKNDRPNMPVPTVEPDVAGPDEDEVHFSFENEPLPPLDLKYLLSTPPEPFTFDVSANPISIDVLSITGGTSSPVSQPHIFYDTEVRAILYRHKSKSSGLVATTMWSWYGKRAEFGEKEEWKLNDLAKRFGTKAVACEQGGEPHDLVSLLGGVVAVRQGTRSHWSVENTSMHCVRVIGDSVFIDEVDLAITNLCSAFSYCVSVLGAIYVWHGRGSSAEERQQCMTCAQSLAGDSLTVTEFDEGEEDPMFWMMLGEESFASAHYWQFKPEVTTFSPKLYRVTASEIAQPVQLVPRFTSKTFEPMGIFVLDGVFEVAVIVGTEARGNRVDIRLAMGLAESISNASPAQRPFTPPVHILVLPSQLPLDFMSGHARFLDSDVINNGSCPEHMNLINLEAAKDSLSRTSWPKSELSDPTFLPLGISPSMIRK